MNNRPCRQENTRALSGCAPLLRLVLKLFLHSEYREELMKDLDELYRAESTELGSLPARRHYWRRAVESLPALLLVQWMEVLDMFVSYGRLALRHFKKQRLHSFITTLSFSVGLACSILIMMYAGHELGYDRFHEKGAAIYRLLYENNTGQISKVTNITSGAIAAAIQDDFPEIRVACRFWKQFSAKILVQADQHLFAEKRIGFTDGAFFQMFSYEMVEGDGGNLLNAPNEAVLTQSTKVKYFGDAPALGKRIRLDHTHDYLVVGVIADPPSQSHLGFDLLLSARSIGLHYPWGLDSWGTNSCNTYIEVRPGVDIEALEAKLPGFFRRHEIMDEEDRYSLQSLYDIHLHSTHIANHSGDIQVVRLLAGIALLILLIAAFNYVNLATARGPLRSIEISMRKVMGASRKNLMALFLGESILFSALATLTALVLVSGLLPAFNQMVQRSLTLRPFITWETAGLLALLALGLGVGAGFYPALHLSKLSPRAAWLKSKPAGRRSGLAFRQVVIVMQFVVSIILILCAVTINGQMRHINTWALGFESESIVTLQLEDKALQKNAHALKSDLLELVLVEDVCLSSALPLGSNMSRTTTNPDWAGPGAPETIQYYDSFVEPHFLDFFGMKIVNGRGFLKGSIADRHAMIINETAVKEFDWADPLGREIDGRRVIGVVRDFHFQSLANAVKPMLISLNEAGEGRYVALKINKDRLQEALVEVEKVWQVHANAYPFSYRFLDDRVDAMYGEEKRLNAIVLAFALLAIALSCFGLLGLSQFRVEQRRKEVGIRRTLGASKRQIFMALSMDFLKWVGVANLFAWPVAYWILQRWLMNYTYRIQLGIHHFLIAGLSALGVALIVISIQTLKAAISNPVESLRHE